MKSILKLIFSIIAICLFYGVSAQTNKDNPRKITWSLETEGGDPLSADIATISATGVITAKDAATVVVVMTVEQGKDKKALSSRKKVKIVPSFGDAVLTSSKSPKYDEDGVITHLGELLTLSVKLTNESGDDITSTSDNIEWKLSNANCIKLNPVMAGVVANTAKIEALSCKECDVEVEAVITNKGATINSNKKLLKIRFVPTSIEYVNNNSVVLPTFKSTETLQIKAVHATTNTAALPCNVLDMPAVSATGTETTISWASTNAGAATPATQAEKSYDANGHKINIEAACFNKNASTYKATVKRNKLSLDAGNITVTSRLDPTHMNITYSNSETVSYKNATTDIIVDKIYSAKDGSDNSCLIQSATVNISAIPTSTCIAKFPDSPTLAKATDQTHKYTFSAPCANNDYEYILKIIPPASAVDAVPLEKVIKLSVDLKPSAIDIDGPTIPLKGSGDAVTLKALVYSNHPASERSCQIQDCPNITVGWNNKNTSSGLISKSLTNYAQLANSAETVGGTIEQANTSGITYFFGKNNQMQTYVDVVAIAAKDGKAVVVSSPKSIFYNYQPQKVYFSPDNIVLNSNGDSKYVTVKVDYTLPGNAAFDKCEVTSTSSATANLGSITSSNLSFSVLNFDKINPAGAIVENPLSKTLIKASCSEEKSTFLIRISRGGKEISSGNIENERLKVTTNLEVTNAIIHIDGKATDYTINDMGSIPVKLIVYSDAAKDNKCNLTDLAAATTKPILNEKWAFASGNGVDVASLGAANIQQFEALVPCLNNNYNLDTQLKVTKIYRFDAAKAVATLNSPMIKARFQPSQETSYLTIDPVDAVNNCNTERTVTPIIYAFTRKGCAVDERTSPAEPFTIVSSTVYGEAVRARVSGTTKALKFIPLQATSDFATATYEVVINKNGSKNVSLKAPFDVYGIKDYYNAVPTFHSFDSKGQPTFTLKAYKYWLNGCVGSDLEAGFIPENAAIAREVN